MCMGVKSRALTLSLTLTLTLSLLLGTLGQMALCYGWYLSCPSSSPPSPTSTATSATSTATATATATGTLGCSVALWGVVLGTAHFYAMEVDDHPYT